MTNESELFVGSAITLLSRNQELKQEQHDKDQGEKHMALEHGPKKRRPLLRYNMLRVLVFLDVCFPITGSSD